MLPICRKFDAFGKVESSRPVCFGNEIDNRILAIR